MTTNTPATMPQCQVVHTPGSYEGKQGPTYAAGVSAESVGAQAIWLGLINVAPGGRTKAHYHEHHETALYMLEGVVDMWSGPKLETHHEARAGDYIYIPAGVPHVAVNRSATEPARVIGSRTDPNEQESVVLTPHLDARVPV